ncbi:MAG TPA: phospholipid scramblase-related protein, partial [Blastocatellia bacterium]|nr:phospholipid scramblase-related protein [Blastocatellia bacterium]
NLFRARVTVHDRVGNELGHFKSKFFSIGGGFHVLDAFDKPVADIKGDWKGWNFRFLAADGTELGKVTKKWAGLGKELFTSADNYMIALDENRTFPPEAVALLLAAGLAIDIVYKEH